ncbi:hypothetical protein F7725_014082 [Dissostichus mawsoni]|uniref:Uncharacterized protein n=1 Tax=Dissostichus mawsoni TaxID=36200 RepID=A0A7J5YUY2_DISMA|nr:hypothetical protein F7725_014082 [Dissostichus mawsoni]
MFERNLHCSDRSGVCFKPGARAALPPLPSVGSHARPPRPPLHSDEGRVYAASLQEMDGLVGAVEARLSGPPGRGVTECRLWPIGPEGSLQTPAAPPCSGVTPPSDRRYDGIDATDVLLHGEQTGHEFLFHPNSGAAGEFGDLQTVRSGKHKAFYITGAAEACGGATGREQLHDPPLIFDLEVNESEETPLDTETLEYQAVAQRMARRREELLWDIANDKSVSAADYSTDASAAPCCDPEHTVCRFTLVADWRELVLVVQADGALGELVLRDNVTCLGSTFLRVTWGEKEEEGEYTVPMRVVEEGGVEGRATVAAYDWLVGGGEPFWILLFLLLYLLLTGLKQPAAAEHTETL